MRDYPHVLSRLIHTPLMAHPVKAQIVTSVVLQRAGIEVNIGVTDAQFGPLQEERLRDQLADWQRLGYEFGDKPYLFDRASGTAVIDVIGSLAHRQGIVGASSGVLGYDWIGAQFGAADTDSEVRQIIFDIHSGGGEVSGCFQLADRIAAATKTTIALSNEMAFSAAYALAAACDQVMLASDTSAVGSIGVCALHVSYEKWLKNEGIKPTIIKAGAHKDDGNPFEDLPADVLARIQADIDAINDLFVARVANWRGVSENSVRAMNADEFRGRLALGAGLADAIASPEEITAALAA